MEATETPEGAKSTTPRRPNEIGPVGQRVAENVKRLREIRGKLSTRTLAERLKEQGRPIPATGITKIEAGVDARSALRHVDVDDLVALAIELGVNPSRLLLPVDGDTVALTPETTVPLRDAWDWADGKAPLPSAEEEREAAEDFARVARPLWRRRRWGHWAMRAAESATSSVERLADLDSETEDPEEAIKAAERAIQRLQDEVGELISQHRQVRRDVHGER